MFIADIFEISEYAPEAAYWLTLIGMRGDTFISLSFLDQILSADILSKLYKLWHQSSYFDTLSLGF